MPYTEEDSDLCCDPFAVFVVMIDVFVDGVVAIGVVILVAVDAVTIHGTVDGAVDVVVDSDVVLVGTVVVDIVIGVLIDAVVTVGVVIVDTVTQEPPVTEHKGEKRPDGDRETDSGEKMLRMTVPTQNQTQQI